MDVAVQRWKVLNTTDENTDPKTTADYYDEICENSKVKDKVCDRFFSCFKTIIRLRLC